ncbi:MAG: sigma-70 family RNA polymerase sigma factor [Actinomycetota bacterium]|nr:sigma-70 family RNA polymerase sigma factor [Actinomycetota bacterium]
MNPPTTTALVAAALHGDRQAWERIVDRYARLVWSVVRGFRLGDAASADVAQTVWLRLVENLDQIRDPEKLAAWLGTTARNEALRAMRSRQRVIPTDFETDIPDPGADRFDEDMIQAEQLTELAAAMRRVSADCQQLLRLLATDPPLDYDTIAELIGRPKGSIGPTRARCISKLRRFIEGRSDGDDRPGKPLPESSR